MTLAEQSTAIQAFGYTAREAAFLSLAALHSGCFLRRQFCPKRGKLADALCRKILAHEHAKTTVYAHNTHVYHLCAKPLYAALGQQDNRHRRPHETFYIRAKLMGLDYVLAHPAYRFLPTEQEKVAYFCEVRGIAQKTLPTKVYTGRHESRTERCFVDKNPVRIDPDTGRTAFCFIDDGVHTTPGFATWLGQYAPLLEALGESEVICVAASEAAFAPAQREFAKRFPAAGAVMAPELAGWFEMREDFERNGPAGRTQEALDNFRRLSRRYSDTRFHHRYEAWQKAKATPGGTPQIVFSTCVLPHSYAFFGTAAGGGNQ